MSNYSLVSPTTSPDGSMNRKNGATEKPGCTNRGDLDCLASTPGAALYSAEDSIQEPNLACCQEQLEYQYRPRTPGEEEILRIYEDRIYCPPDMRNQEVYDSQDLIWDLGEAPALEDMEDVVDELQAIVEELLPWLKDGIFSSESCTPRTPSPDIELENLSESE